MAYANFNAPQPGFGSNPILSAAVEKYKTDTNKEIQDKILKQEKSNLYQKLANDLAVARLNNANAKRIAEMRIEADKAMKQMGIDSDQLINRLKNLNSLEVAELQGKLAQTLERLKDKNVQSQIIKQYQTNLELHAFDQKQALMRTFIDTMGDIYKTGNPLDNAVDTAAFGIWTIAFINAYNALDMSRTVESDKGKSSVGDITTRFDVGSDSEGGKDESEANEVIRLLKEAAAKNGGQQNKGKEKYAKPSLKTKIRLMENQRAGQPHIYQRP